MKVVVQRVKEAEVKVNEKSVGKIKEGLLVLVGFTYGDNEDNIDYIINKLINLRIFDDNDGIMNLSIKDKGYDILSVSQFTLYADTLKGNRPSYIKSLKSDEAKVLYDLFNKKLKDQGIHVETGIFREDMKVSLINDGPVTIILEKEIGNSNVK